MLVMVLVVSEAALVLVRRPHRRSILYTQSIHNRSELYHTTLGIHWMWVVWVEVVLVLGRPHRRSILHTQSIHNLHEIHHTTLGIHWM